MKYWSNFHMGRGNISDSFMLTSTFSVTKMPRRNCYEKNYLLCMLFAWFNTRTNMCSGPPLRWKHL